MSLAPNQTPSDEYEQLQAARRRRAKKIVVICYAVTCVPYVASWVIGLSGSERQGWLPFLIAYGVAWACGFATGIVTFFHWPLLSWSDRAFGLAPWFYFTLMSLPFVADMLQ